MEQWLAVVGYEGIYEVSDLGNVRRIAPWCDGRPIKIRGELTGKVTKSGYRRVTLQRDYKGKEFAVHRLVMAAFVGPLPTSTHQVNHRNGKRADNRLENLEYLSPSANQLHACRILGRPSRPGSKHHAAKVSEAQVRKIRALRLKGWTLKELSAKFGLCCSTLCWIAKGKAWTHI